MPATGRWGSRTCRIPMRRRALPRTISRRADRIADVVCRETGKPRVDAVLAEAMHAAAHVDWLARHAGRALAPRKVSPWPLYSKAAWVEYQPRGVAAVVAPWNYPFLLPFLATASALAAGCTVVLKPSEVAPASGELVAERVAEAGLLDGVVQVLHGGPAVGAALVQAGVDVVAVTGSSATGRRVAALAAQRRDPAPRRPPHGRGRALVRADAADRGRPRHGGDARGDVRARPAGDARARRGGRRAPGQ